MKNILNKGILTMLFIIGSLQILQAQYVTKCNVSMCLTCKGSGRVWVKQTYIAYDNLIKHDKSGWNRGTEYTYTNSYLKTTGDYQSCNVCAGKGRYKKCRQVYQKKKVVRYLNSKQMMRLSYNKALKDFVKIVKDLGNGKLVATNRSGVTSIIQLHRTKVGYEYLKLPFHGYKELKNPYGEFYAHQLKSKLAWNNRYSYFDKNVKEIYKISNEHNPLYYNDLYWVESEKPTEKSELIKKAYLYNANSGKILTSDSYVLGDVSNRIAHQLVTSGYYVTYKYKKDITNNWVKLLGIIDEKENIIVPFNNRKVIDFDNNSGLITVVNQFNLIDRYSVSGKLYEPVGKIVKECENGKVIKEIEKELYTKQSIVTQKVLTVFDIKNNSSYNYIFSNCKCEDGKGWQEVALIGKENKDYYIRKDGIFFGKSTQKLNDKVSKLLKLKVFDIKKADFIQASSLKLKTTTKNDKIGFVDYKKGKPLFDNVSIVYHFNFRIVQIDNKCKLLIKHPEKEKWKLLPHFYKNVDIKQSSEKFVVVQNLSNKWGVIGLDWKNEGQTLIDFEFDSFLNTNNYLLGKQSNIKKLFSIYSLLSSGKAKPIIQNKLSKQKQNTLSYREMFPYMTKSFFNNRLASIKLEINVNDKIEDFGKNGKLFFTKFHNMGMFIAFKNKHLKNISILIPLDINKIKLIYEDAKNEKYIFLTEYRNGNKGLVYLTKGKTIRQKIDGKYTRKRIYRYQYHEKVSNIYGFKNYHGIRQNNSSIEFIFSDQHGFYINSFNKYDKFDLKLLKMK